MTVLFINDAEKIVRHHLWGGGGGGGGGVRFELLNEIFVQLGA